MTVSVVIATYRRLLELERALVSLTAQTYKDFEVVLVDDNADAVWNAKVKNIVEKYNDIINILYIVNSCNQGSAKTRNIGIERSNGEYITFLDDDDEYLPGKIENQLNDLIAKKADYSITDLDLYNENGKLLNKRTRHYIKQYDAESLFRYHLLYHMTGTDTLMFKKSYLLAIGCFSLIDSGDEFYLMCKAIQAGGMLAYYRGCDVMAYVHKQDGLSSGKNRIKGENALFEYKRTMYKNMDFYTRQNISMRHYAVLAYTYLKMQKYGRCFLNGMRSFLCTPTGCIRLIREYRYESSDNQS